MRQAVGRYHARSHACSTSHRGGMRLDMTHGPRSMISLGLLLLGGCTVSTPDAVVEGHPDPLRAGLTEAAGAVLDRLTNADTGLEVRTWIVPDDAERVARAFSRFQDGQPLDAPSAERFRRNGLRVVRVPLEDLLPCLEALGEASLDLTAWHGQVYAWRELHHRPLRAGGHALAVNGRVRRYEGGSLYLMLRCWQMQMEDAPFLNLELMPHYVAGGSGRSGRRGGSREPLTTLAMRLKLDRGYAYILVAEDPQTEWAGIEPQDASSARGEADAEPDSPRPAAGPAAMAPPTVGELLFMSTSPRPSRGLMVFIPRLASDLFPTQPLASDASAAAREGS